MFIKVCPTCKRSFVKNKYYSKNYWKKQKYCSLKCSGTLLKKGLTPWNKGIYGLFIGEKSFNWKGGRLPAAYGYIRILIRGKGKYQLEHRAVMEKYLGRKLKRSEHVHHINRIKTDNRIENLTVIDIRKHGSIHSLERWHKIKVGGF
jgi:hypothetical protein